MAQIRLLQCNYRRRATTTDIDGRYFCRCCRHVGAVCPDPDWPGETPEKVMVVGLAERRYRTPFEGAFVEELRSRGFNAVTSSAYAPILADNTAAAHYGLEVQFFDTKSDRMIWTAKTKTFDAGDIDDLVIVLADLMIDDLIAKGVIE